MTRTFASTDQTAGGAASPGLPGEQWTVFVIPFSHNDIGWAGTPAEVADHRASIIDEALALLAAPERSFRFSMEAALYLTEYLDRRPASAGRLREELRRGGLEWGAAYVQCYEGLQTDEGLLRQFTVGRALLESAVGYSPRGYWNVDVVARTLQLPQVLRHCGIEYMVVSRNRPGMYWWQAPDGTRILTFNFWEGSYGRATVFDSERRHHSPLEAGSESEGGQPLDLALVRERLTSLAAQWSGTLEEIGLPPALAIVLAADYNVPDPEILELVRRSATTPAGDGEPRIELIIGTVGEYIDWVTERCTLDCLPTEMGEVPNPWVYQQPGHWEIVSQLRRAQSAIIAAEAAWTLVAVQRQNWSDYPAAALQAAWEDALYPDHGYGGMHGEGTDSVFHDRVNRGFFGAQRLVHNALRTLASADPVAGSGAQVVVFNASDRPVSDWVELSGVEVGDGDDVLVQSIDGDTVDHQLLGEPTSVARRVGVLIRDVPGFGAHALRVQRGARAAERRPADPLRTAGADLIWDTGDVLARISPAGLAELRVDGTRLILADRFMAGEVIQLASPGVDVGTHEADPAYDWRIVRPFQPHADGPVRPQAIGLDVIERGPIRWTVEAVSRHEQCLVTQRFSFYPGLDRIDLSASITGWTGEHGRELRWVFPVASPTGRVRYGVPFGHATVGADEVQEFADLRPRELLRWLLAGAEPATLALSTPLTTFDWRDPTGLDDDQTYLQLVLLATKRSIHPRGNWYGQEGSHTFAASIHLHAHEPAALELAARQRGALWCSALGQPPALEPVRPAAAKLIAALEPEHVSITAVKKHDRESSVVVRLFETSGQAASVRLRTGFAVAEVHELDGRESPTERCDDLRRTAPDMVELSLGPWQIATLALIPDVGP